MMFSPAFTGKVTRFEVIDKDGRSYVTYDVSSIRFSLQDDGRTIKVFIENDSSKPNTN